MNRKKTIFAVLGAVIVLALIVLLIRVVTGAFELLSGAVNAVLGIVIIAALVLIVAWMLLYARKK